MACCRRRSRLSTPAARRGFSIRLTFNTTTVKVTKSVTILAVPGALGSLVAPLDTDALAINVAVGRVTLRQPERPGPERSELGDHRNTSVERKQSPHRELRDLWRSIGISITADGSSTTLVNATIHDVLDGVAVNLAAHASMDRSSISNTARAVRAEEGARVTVNDSTLTTRRSRSSRARTLSPARSSMSPWAGH